MFKNLLILVMMVILVIRIATLDSLQGKTLVTKVIKEILATEEFPHLKLAAHPGNKGNAGNIVNVHFHLFKTYELGSLFARDFLTKDLFQTNKNVEK